LLRASEGPITGGKRLAPGVLKGKEALDGSRAISSGTVKETKTAAGIDANTARENLEGQAS
jgi:hypothetical protein